MEQNLSVSEVALRYVIGVIVGIIGGVMHSTIVMALAIPFFLTGLMALDPIKAMLKSSKAK